MNINSGNPKDMAIKGITCNVENCHYNEQRLCIAKEIQVGPQYASSSADTVCDTFRPR